MGYLLKTLLFILFSFLFFQINTFSQTTKTKDHCKNLSKIKSIPIKPLDARKVDTDYKEYLEVLKSGDAAIPCLIENITNTEEMKDPRCPSVGIVAVGDVAYFLLYRIGKFKFEEMLPEEFQEKYKTDGGFAYLEFVSEDKNRKWLQTNLKEWYSSKNQTKK